MFEITVTAFNAIYLYNIFLSIFGWKVPDKPETYNINKERSFTILIPCHNEEDVIIDNIFSICESNYNKDKFNIFVIADNCTDRTIERCLEFKKQKSDFRIEVIPVSGGSKPKAINKSIDFLKSFNAWKDDSIIILDADNKISPDLLSSFNYYHNRFNMVQCRIMSANDSTIVSKGFTSAFNHMARSFQVARNKLNLSASLSGTGFSINRQIFDEIDFSKCNSLTEDLEFSILSIIQGYKVKYIHHEYVLNQNVDEFKASIIQRVRWCRGHMQVSIKLSLDLIKAFFRKPSWQLIDTFLFLNNPPKAILFLLVSTMDLILGLIGNYGAMSILVLTVIYQFIFILHINKYRIRYIAPHVLYSVTMYFIIIWGTLTYKNTIWAKTIHKKI